MVKKLFKHEFISYGRIMAIVYAIVLTVAAATRILLSFESDSVAFDIIGVMCVFVYVVSFITAIVFAFALHIIRFYRHLFTAEGYLTFTLPVTTNQHILVKAVTAVCVQLITWLVLAISFCIVMAGEPLVEMIQDMGKLFTDMYQHLGIHSILYGMELLILLVMSAFSGALLYYTYISIGQLFSKNRILAAVGAYFVHYIITQIFFTVFTIILSMNLSIEVLDAFSVWATLHPYATIHIALLGGLASFTIFSLIEFLIIKKIISKKLNLE